jgi:hypothetical protein
MPHLRARVAVTALLVLGSLVPSAGAAATDLAAAPAVLTAPATLTAPTPDALAAPTPVAAIDQCVTLAQLGVRPVEATHLTRTTVIRQFSITFPAGATEGPTDWFLIRFHVRVIRPSDSVGTALITAETDGMTDAQIEYNMTPAGVDWSTVSAAEPTQKVHTASRAIDTDMTNYLQTAGVRGGSNTAAFRVELDNGAELDDVRILGDTCIERTTLTPETLKVDTLTAPRTTARGGDVTLTVHVRNVGTRPITKLTVYTSADGTGLTATSPTSVSTDNLTGAWTAEFRFHARSTGQHTVHVDVGTAISDEVGDDVVTVDVQPATGSLASYVILGLFGGALVLLAVSWVAAMRRRKRRERFRPRVRALR